MAEGGRHRARRQRLSAEDVRRVTDGRRAVRALRRAAGPFTQTNEVVSIPAEPSSPLTRVCFVLGVWEGIEEESRLALVVPLGDEWTAVAGEMDVMQGAAFRTRRRRFAQASPEHHAVVAAAVDALRRGYLAVLHDRAAEEGAAGRWTQYRQRRAIARLMEWAPSARGLEG